MSFYGLYIPAKGANANGGTPTSASAGITGATAAASGNVDRDQTSADSPYVFRVKSEALEVLKLHKEARLREFVSEDDALKYAQTGHEIVQTRYTDVRTSTAALEKAAFRAPTKQELIEFRKIIEAGDHDRIKSIIWENPRYLVSSGDTPTTLKEGPRYNAMHICALSKKARIAELILQTVADPNFVDLLTGKKNDEKMCKELCVNLLDYYLNMPEKGRSETPLHLAVKTGAIEVVAVLTSYPECKMTPNHEGLLPKYLICSRVPHPDSDVCKKIETMLEERFYVPVLCSMDGAVPPHIGEPFSSKNPPNLNCDPLSPEVKIQALAGPMDKEQAKKFCRRWKTPPRVGSSSYSPIANNPFISPRKSRNNSFCNTPKKSHTNDSTGGNMPTSRSLFNSTPLKLTPTTSTPIQSNGLDDLVANKENLDQQNGNHKHESFAEVEQDFNASLLNEANNNTSDHPLGPAELHQSFSAPNLPSTGTKSSMVRSGLFPKTPLFKLNRAGFFTYREQHAPSPVVFDMSSSDSNLFNDYDPYESPGYKERNLKITDTEKGLEVIGRELAKEQHVEWIEYWDFLNTFTNMNSTEGLDMLEQYFAKRTKEIEATKQNPKALAKSAEILNNVCNALEKLAFPQDSTAQNDVRGIERKGVDAPPAVTNPQAANPYTCVEKSLQVFAKRMTKTIIHNIDNVVSINDTLLSELKRLKSLICSFKEDARFVNVDFSKVHSRIGNLISIYLDSSQEVTATVKSKIQTIMQNILLSPITPMPHISHIDCVCRRIHFMLMSSANQILPENLKTEAMCSQVWQLEKLCECQWENNLSRKTSRRSRFLELRYKQTQQAKQQERAQKELQKREAGTDSYRDHSSSNESSDEQEEDIFWSDFGSSDSEVDELWFTPPESPSRISMLENVEDSYQIYIYGNQPTKRDSDVLNAIFHIELDKTKYPHITAWKNAVLRHSNEEMDAFPSPSIVRKSHSIFSSNSSLLPQKSTLHQSSSSELSKPSPLPIAKRLFMSPTAAKNVPLQAPQGFKTPLNKLRGLFSTYRDRNVEDNSPDCRISHAETNLSLMGVSSSK